MWCEESYVDAHCPHPFELLVMNNLAAADNFQSLKGLGRYCVDLAIVRSWVQIVFKKC